MKLPLSGGPKLFEHFVVCGLTGQGLVSLNGDTGFAGAEAAYKPSYIDHLPLWDDPKDQPPPQLPTVSLQQEPTDCGFLPRPPCHPNPPACLCVQCCLPEGVQIVLKGEQGASTSAPKAYSVILTGTALWAALIQIVYSLTRPWWHGRTTQTH